MAMQPKKISILPVLKTFYAVLIICSLLSCSDGQACNCSHSDQQRPGSRTAAMTSTFEQMDGDLFLVNPSQGTYLPGNLGTYMKNSSSSFNFSDVGLFIIPNSVILWEKITDFMEPREVSFSLTITMSAYRTQVNNSSRLTVAILPRVPYSENGSMSIPLNGFLEPYFPESRTIAASNVSIQIGSTNLNSRKVESRILWIEITIEQADGSADGNYTLWIDYDRIWHRISVYVDIEAGVKPKPTTPVALFPLILSDTMGQVGFFSLSSTMGQLLQLHTWSSTVEQLQLSSSDCTAPTYSMKGRLSPVIIYPLVGVCVTVMMVSIVYCYFKSKYRRWKKDLEKLAKSMQRLPGMPVQVNFADIKKATNNFHEKTVLGRGTYGVVYKCRLPNQKSGDIMKEVAVKMFTRDERRGYEDFLTEVSVISRLRHKNIVSLIGWSYNRGQPILIYEYMPKGSLDQHLFHKTSDGQQEPTTSPICKWHTRYNIVKDVATGLRYIHHEYEPLVLHRDIKASNILIDSAFHGRLGDFGIACVVGNGKNSYTESGARGTFGFMAPEYVTTGQATRETDIFAFGVLILEIVTGKPPISSSLVHITEWVWMYHLEGKLPDTVDPVLAASGEYDRSDAISLLLLGLACTSPNPSDRPDMVKALQVINKLVAPPAVPFENPRFSRRPPLEEWCSDYKTSTSNSNQSSGTVVEMVSTRPSLECISVYHTADTGRIH